MSGITFSPLVLPPLLLVLPPSRHAVSCGIREMIKEDSFKYLSNLSLMALQSRWAWRMWESVRSMPVCLVETAEEVNTECIDMDVRVQVFLYISTNRRVMQVVCAWECPLVIRGNKSL